MARVSNPARELRSIRLAVRMIERAVARLAKAVRTVRVEPQEKTSRRTLKLSPARRAALKLHGQYIGLLRHLKPAQQSRVKAVRAGKGYDASIRLAKRLTRG